MENFDKIILLLTENQKGFSLNTDILETGLINIAALVFILIYAGRDFVGSALETRKISIIESVQDAENKLNEANQRLNEAKKQVEQANLVIGEIKNETIETKKSLLKSDAYQSKKDLEVRFSRALATFRSKERQVFLEVKQQIILLVLKLTVSRAKQTFGSKDKATKLINETINKLEGDLL